MTDPKPRPNDRIYVDALRHMTPEQRLAKAIELGELSRELLRAGLRQRFPEADEAELERLYRRQVEKCHNRDY